MLVQFLAKDTSIAFLVISESADDSLETLWYEFGLVVFHYWKINYFLKFDNDTDCSSMQFCSVLVIEIWTKISPQRRTTLLTWVTVMVQSFTRRNALSFKIPSATSHHSFSSVSSFLFSLRINELSRKGRLAFSLAIIFLLALHEF